MRILVVEDELSKKENIISLVNENFPKSTLLEAHSVKSAKILLKNKEGFDCIILDMSLPTFDIGRNEFGGRPQGFGGKEVIRQLFRDNRCIPIVVVTAYDFFSNLEASDESMSLDELKKQLNKYSSKLTISVIKYSGLIDDWKEKLIEFLQEVDENINS
ncbi:response regulator [Psychrobacter sp. UBA3480]|uniref:response regulator n=1 Tax=Psychrobacter sp. UBA3480 TaxID=1947350 RepID=UPI0025F2450E|nr:response regulator [Psychrobacter sp. UBA3480]